MATLQELENQVTAAQKVVDDLDAQLSNPKLSDAQYDALRNKRDDADDTLTDLTGKRDKLKKTQGVTEGGLKDSQDFAQQQIEIFESRYEKALKEFNKNPSSKGLAKGYDLRDDLKKAGKNLNSAYDNADALGLKVPRIIEGTEESGFVPAGSTAENGAGITVPPNPPRSTTGAAATDATTVKSKVTVVKNGNNVEITTFMDGRISEKVLGPSNLPDTAASNLPKDTSGNAASMKTYVDAQLKAKGLADTPANRKMLREAYQALTPEEKVAAVPAVPGAKAPPGADNAWEQLFIKNNPAKAWYLTELDRAKYPQLFAILKEYALARPLTVEEQAAFAAKLDGTDFFRELSTSGKIREIKKVVGDLGFDGSDFTRFVHTAINMGYTGDRLKEETYKEVFKKGDDGKYINPIAFKRVIAGNDYLNVKLIGKQYFNEVSSDTIEKVLTGEIGSTDVQRQQRYLAGQKYQHLDNLLEQGLTLQDIASSYQTSAAKLLEVDLNTIDMSAADYEVALNFGEEGKKRMMTSGEWDRLLRTESKYGWEKTNNAKQEARGLASSLVQAFGRII